MFLKRLEIYGFKSFAEKTVFEFEKGITCVIGPNGTGKSNLVEAILWVLGSQNPRDLRGAKMEDIIFNGSDTKKPLGLTYVTLVLDNSDRVIDVDYSEISITRKYYRSGESEFYINNAECRLKDIIDLFTDTGLGKNGYSIIGQGKIDEILNSRPDEKRGLFEEAAGIMKYKNKRGESIKKLDVTQDNLNRLNDIISEIHGRLIPLYQESVKAREYASLSEQYRLYRINECLINYKKIESENAILSQEIENGKENFGILRKDIDTAELKLKEVNASVENLKTEEKSTNDSLYSQKNLLERNRGEINLLNLQQSGSKKELGKNDLSIRELIENTRSQREEMNKFNAQADDLNFRSGMMDTQEKNYIKNIELIEGIIHSIDSMHDTVKIKKDDIERVNLIKDNEIKHINRDISEKVNYLHGLESRYNEQSSLMHIVEDDIRKAVYDKKIINEEIGPIKEVIAKLEDRIKADKNEYARCIDRSNNLKKNIQIINTRRKVLEDMKRNHDGLNEGSKYLLNLNDKNVYGFVGGLIELDREYERAIETALGGSIEYIIVKSEEDAKRLISLLKAKKAGRATFIPLSSVKPRPCRKIQGSGYLGRASELINYDGIFKNAMEFLLGNVYVFDSIDNAIEVSKRYNYSLKSVTLEGENISPGGLISGGFRRKSYNFFTRENEIKKLKFEVEQYYLDLKRINEQIAEINTNIGTQEIELNDLTIKLTALSDKKRSYDEQLKDLFKNRKDYKNNFTDLTDQIDTCRKDVQKAKNTCDTFEKEAADNDLKLKQMNILIGELETIEDDLEDKHGKIMKAFEDFKITNAASMAERQSLDRHVEELYDKIHAAIADIRMLLSERSNLRRSIKDMQKMIKIKMAGQHDLMHQISTLEAHNDDVKRKIFAAENEKNRISENYKKIQDDMLSANNHMKEVEIKQGRLLLSMENISSRLTDEFDLTINEAVTYEDESMSGNDLQREINILKRKLDILGNVNMNAVEEYEETKERYDFLTSQYKDTIESRDSLLKIINDADKIIYNRFNKFLKQANNVFRGNFVKLFGGGQAEIKLTDKDHPEASGIEIIVQPPGKRLQNMSLLSGGERALVAIALLFSLLELNHSPFVILDEIDSALDDANIERFVNFLKHISRDIQFILITHRPGTAEVANAIYGITMEEKGITKKVSIKFDEAIDWR